MRIVKMLLGVALCGLSSVPCQAALLFSDDFTYATGLSQTSLVNGVNGGWIATTANVDVLNDAIGTSYGIPAFGQGNYIDLGGTVTSGSASAVFSTNSSFIAGVLTDEKVLSFGLAGNNRSVFGPVSDTVLVTFGTYSESFTLARGAAFTQFTRTLLNSVNGILTFTVTTPFTTQVASEQGPLLDNVSLNDQLINTVPEPAFASVALLLSGLVFARRRKFVKAV